VQRVRDAPVSSLIIAINVIVFILASRTGKTTDIATLLRFGAVSRNEVWHGQYWRLVTAMFMHVGVIHLLWNGYYGFLMSAEVERGIGWWRFLLLYLLSGIAGSAASVIGHNAVSAGASGALFGLIGLQLGLARAGAGSFRAMWKDAGLRRNLALIGGWFVVGVFVGFDNYAHGGGLAFGLLFTWTLLVPPPRRWKRMAVALVALAVLVALSLRPLPLIHTRPRALWQAMRTQDNPAEVLALTEPLMGAADWRPRAQRLRGWAFVKLNRFQEGVDAANEAITDFPQDASVYLTRGMARWALGDAGGAEADFRQVLALDRSADSSVRDAVAWYRSHRPQ
jgi:membrane associated rhomboid family serine protease